jgi:membrane associated rhomboid family serine protease
MLPIRDENPSRITPYVTWGLIGANVLLFLYELSLGQRLPDFLFQAAFIPARTFGEAGGGLQLGGALLSMFLHGGIAHVAGNMLFLWIFGDNVEDRLGHLRFVMFYLGCGFAATYAHALAAPHSQVPAVGASGAIAGVLGAYLILYPRARIVTVIILGFFIDFIKVPALVYLPIWFLLQFVSGVASLGAETSAQAGGVAWFAHIGGFVAGPVLLFLLGGLRGRRPPRRPRPTLLDV